MESVLGGELSAMPALRVLKIRCFDDQELVTGLIRGLQYHPSFKILEVEFYQVLIEAAWTKQEIDAAFHCDILHAARGTGIEVKVTYGE